MNLVWKTIPCLVLCPEKCASDQIHWTSGPTAEVTLPKSLVRAVPPAVLQTHVCELDWLECGTLESALYERSNVLYMFVHGLSDSKVFWTTSANDIYDVHRDDVLLQTRNTLRRQTE